MYIDSLTIAAFVVFVIAFVMFIWNCVMKNCGSGCSDIEHCDNGEHHYKV